MYKKLNICGGDNLSLMPFYWISFQWRILRGMMAVQRGRTWCLRASAKSWIRRTRPSRLSKAPSCNSTSPGEVRLWAKNWLWFCWVWKQNLMPLVTRSLQVTNSSVIQCVLLLPNVSCPHISVSYESDTVVHHVVI